MVLLPVCLAALISAPGQPELYDFSATWCAPCKAMEPTVRRLETSGYPVRRIDVDREPQLARQFNVESLPCFVVVQDGRERARIHGTTSYEKLVALFPPRTEATAGPSTGSPPNRPNNVRGQSPDQFHPPAEIGRDPRPRSAQEIAQQATVRLRACERDGHSSGTGTIIDARNQEALILTCGHIFRDSRGKGRIEVDLFVNGEVRTVPGHLVDYDADYCDLGLISIRPGVPITPVRLATTSQVVRPGDRVFSIGCDQGAVPTVRTSQVSGLDKFSGAGTITVAGQPTQGRSGGGLFTWDGTLIGVCKWASPQDNEGVYASFGEVNARLGKLGFSFVHDRPRDPLVRGQEPVGLTPISNRDLPREFPQEFPKPARETPVSTAAGSLADDEIIFIVRSRSQSQGRSEVRVLERISPELRAQVERELRGGK